MTESTTESQLTFLIGHKSRSAITRRQSLPRFDHVRTLVVHFRDLSMGFLRTCGLMRNPNNLFFGQIRSTHGFLAG